MSLYHHMIVAWFTVSLGVFITLLFVTAPYGRHRRSGWGPNMGGRTGWFVMEIPAFITLPALYYLSGSEQTIHFVYCVLWSTHYGHRTLIYPMRHQSNDQEIPRLVVGLGAVTNVLVGLILGYALFFAQVDPWTESYATILLSVGLCLFGIGMYINVRADHHLLTLRRQPGPRYKLPTDGVYRHVSCPNYLGECIEWLGFALLTQSVAALAFLAWTCSNLIPRALSHHAWYRERFKEYPEHRKAIFPYLL